MSVLTKEQQWHQHIQDCMRSGMSIEAWCKANELSAYRYHYWKKKFINMEKGSQSNAVEWAPLIVSDARAIEPKDTPIILHVNKLRIELKADFDSQALSQLLDLLGALC